MSIAAKRIVPSSVQCGRRTQTLLPNSATIAFVGGANLWFPACSNASGQEAMMHVRMSNNNVSVMQRRQEAQ